MATFWCAFAIALSLDLLPPGHKGVQHECVLTPDAATEGYAFYAATLRAHPHNPRSLSSPIDRLNPENRRSPCDIVVVDM